MAGSGLPSDQVTMTRAMLVLLAATAAGLVPVGPEAEHRATRTTAPEGRVTGVRFWSLGDTTRVVIEVSEDFTLPVGSSAEPGSSLLRHRRRQTHHRPEDQHDTGGRFDRAPDPRGGDAAGYYPRGAGPGR